MIAFLPTCLIGIIYNCALELEASYIIAIMCSLPFILVKQKRRKWNEQIETVDEKNCL